MPALLLEEAGKYVAGAYLVFMTLIVIYVAIIGSKIARIERDVEELADLADERGDKRDVGEPVGAVEERAR